MRSTIASPTNGSSSYEEIGVKKPLTTYVWACETGRLISTSASIANLQRIKPFNIVNLLYKSEA